MPKLDEVGLHGALANRQTLRNLLVGETRCYKADDLHFAWSELAAWRIPAIGSCEPDGGLQVHAETLLPSRRGGFFCERRTAAGLGLAMRLYLGSVPGTGDQSSTASRGQECYAGNMPTLGRGCAC